MNLKLDFGVEQPPNLLDIHIWDALPNLDALC